MSAYDDVDYWVPMRETIIAHEEPRLAKVTYRGSKGEKFRVMVRQKPNPIGFHVRLPGDRK